MGRVGCFLIGDDYGGPSTLPWAVKFPEGLPPSTVASLQEFGVRVPAGLDPGTVLAVHPTQIYETLIMLAVFAYLWSKRNAPGGTGWIFGAYLMFAGAERFLVEILRAKDDRFLGLVHDRAGDEHRGDRGGRDRVREAQAGGRGGAGGVPGEAGQR